MRNKFAKSKSDAKRLIAGGGVDLDGVKILNAAEKAKDGVAKIGKFKFVRLEK